MAIAFTVDAPKSFEANPGLISFHARKPVDTLEVRVNGKRYKVVALTSPQRKATIGPLGLPSQDLTITVTGFRDGKVVGRQTATNVLGLPKASMTILPITKTPPLTQRRMRRLPHPGGTVAAWTVNLASGLGASYNAGARFTAASTAKLPIMIDLLMITKRDIVGSSSWGSLQAMIRSSSNDAANTVLEYIGGSTTSGGAQVTAMAHRLGALHTDTAAGYLAGQDRKGTNPPVQINAQPEVPCCKETTAHDLGILMQQIVEATAGTGRAHRLGLTARDARVALWLLAHTSNPGLFEPWTQWITAHKIGDVDRAWHDVAAIFTPQGPLITVAMTYNENGINQSTSAEYGKRVLHTALTGLQAPPPKPERPIPFHT